jgi:hypothetical protein
LAGGLWPVSFVLPCLLIKTVKMKNKALSIVLLLLFFVSSCTSTYITSRWKAPDIALREYKKIMVVGIIREADRTLREKMENHLVNDLKERGLPAFSAYREYGPKALQNLSEEQVSEKLGKEGVDAVITIVMLDKQRERYYVPGRIVYSPYSIYHNRFWGYYRAIYTRIEMPGYYETSTRYFWECNLYDPVSQKLVYSVQTQSFDPASADALAHEHGKKIVEAMIKDGVLPAGGQAFVKAIVRTGKEKTIEQ